MIHLAVTKEYVRLEMVEERERVEKEKEEERERERERERKREREETNNKVRKSKGNTCKQQEGARK